LADPGAAGGADHNCERARVTAAPTPGQVAPQLNPLVTAAILPTLLQLSLPNLIAMLATAAVAIAETAYAGWLGTSALAGLALVFPMVMLQQMMSAGAMGGGVSSAISRALGAGDAARAQALALHAVVIGLTAGLAFTALFLVGGGSLYRLLGGQGAALQEAMTYSNTVFLGATAIWLTNTFASVLRGTGNMRVPSMVLFGTALAQIGLSGVLGLGLGPVPNFGMAGIAWGQVLAFTGAAATLLWYLTSGRARLQLRADPASLRREMFVDILKVGAVACASPLQSVITVLIITALVAAAGTEALAGYGIGARLEFLLVPLTFALGVASVPMVGMAIGAGNVVRARKVAWTAGLLAAAFIGGIGATVAVFPDAWSRLYSTDPAVLSAARSYFAFAGPAYGCYGLALCLYFACQGSGQMLWPVLAQSVRLGIVAIGGWWLTRIGAPTWMLFAVIAAGMVAYGAAMAAVLYTARWEKR
jgi:putative MATE family efflux protein